MKRQAPHTRQGPAARMLSNLDTPGGSQEVCLHAATYGAGNGGSSPASPCRFPSSGRISPRGVDPVVVDLEPEVDAGEAFGEFEVRATAPEHALALLLADDEPSFVVAIHRQVRKPRPGIEAQQREELVLAVLVELHEVDDFLTGRSVVLVVHGCGPTMESRE